MSTAASSAGAAGAGGGPAAGAGAGAGAAGGRELAAMVAAAVAAPPATAPALLAAACEAVLRHPTLSTQAALVEFAPVLSRGFLASSSMDARHVALRFVEDVAKSEKATAAALVEPMSALAEVLAASSEQPETVLRWAALAAVRSWKSALWVLSRSFRDADACRRLQAVLLETLPGAASEVLRSPLKDRAARINLCKFFEAASASLLGERGRQENERGRAAPSRERQRSFESLMDLPESQHPTLPSAARLSQEGLRFADVLAQRVLAGAADPDQAVRTAATNALTTVARTRPAARSLAVNTLVAAATAPRASPQDGQTLKTSLLVLLKTLAPTPDSVETEEVTRITRALMALGAADNVERHLQPLKRRRQEQEERAARKRNEPYPPQENQFPTSGLNLLPIETLARLIVDNADNVPRYPPPNHRPHPVRAESLNCNQVPPLLERVLNSIRAVETGRGLMLPAPLLRTAPRDVTEEEALYLRMEAFARVASACVEAAKPGSRAGGAGWRPRTYEVCTVLAARLACDFGGRRPLQRSGGGGLAEGGRGSVDGEGGGGGNDDDDDDDSRDDLSLRGGDAAGEGAGERAGGEELAAVPENQDLRTKFLADVIANAVPDTEQVFLAPLAALHVEYAGDLGRGPGAKRYEGFLGSVLDALLAKSPATIPRLLAEAPSVPSSCLRRVLDFSSDATTVVGKQKQYVLGLTTLFELLTSRPRLGRLCCSAVLLHATSKHPEVRGAAVRLTANRVLKLPEWSDVVKRFALAVGDSLALKGRPFVDPETPVWLEAAALVSDGADGFVVDVAGEAPPPPGEAGAASRERIAEETSRRTELVTALCAKDLSMVKDMLALFARVASADWGEEEPEEVRDEVLRTFLLPMDKLWVTILNGLNGNVARGFALLQQFPEGAEELVLRAVVVFAQRDPDAAALAVKTLRAQGRTVSEFERDARFAVPVVGSLAKEEALDALARVATELSAEEVKAAIANMAQGAVGRTVDASELLLSVSTMDCELDALRTATDALLDHPKLVSEASFRKFLDEIVDVVEPPLVLMRVVLRGLTRFPATQSDVLGFLQRMCDRDFWEQDENDLLWEGFVNLVVKLKPHSFPVAFTLPEPVLLQLLAFLDSLRGEGGRVTNTLALMRNYAAADAMLMRAPSPAAEEAASAGDVDVTGMGDEAEGEGDAEAGAEGGSAAAARGAAKKAAAARGLRPLSAAVREKLGLPPLPQPAPAAGPPSAGAVAVA